jgi:thiamine pyrophosphate-dependent acetolactate synthase large subunit-like protein
VSAPEAEADRAQNRPDVVVAPPAGATAEPEWVSDAIVDLLIEAGIEYVAFNPGATVRGIHDSLVNYRDDAPELLLCLNEESSVALAHGYAKATGKPMAVLVHNIVGLQHASMAIYNAWCDRVPILLIGGTGPMSTVKRRPWIDWIHTALVQGELVRDYVKWDDQPSDAASVPTSFARALRTAEADPPGPVYWNIDLDIQEQPYEEMRRSPLSGHPVPTPPGPPPGALSELEEILRSAELPVILTDYAGSTAEGFEALVKVAEAAQAPVIDCGARLSFPSWHDLNFSHVRDVLGEADAVIAFDVEDLHGALVDARPPRVVNVTVSHLKQRAWSHDYQELVPVDLVVTAAAAPTLSALAERFAADPIGAAVRERREQRLAGRARAARGRAWELASVAEAEDAIPEERVAAELWPLIEDRDWVLAHAKPDGVERQLWRFDRPLQHLGWNGGGGLGYGPGASIGATLGRGRDVLCIDFQPDGDLLYAPSALWTAAHYDVPTLFIVDNNRQYDNTVGHSKRLAEARNRPVENRYAGSGIRSPDIDFVALAQTYGVWATGPITDVAELGRALAEAIDVVDGGRPALVEIVTTGD